MPIKLLLREVFPHYDNMMKYIRKREYKSYEREEFISFIGMLIDSFCEGREDLNSKEFACDIAKTIGEVYDENGPFALS